MKKNIRFTLSVYLLIIFSFIFVVVNKILPNALQSIVYSDQVNKLDFILQEKLEQVKNLGHWVWDVDTDNPKFTGNSKDPAVEWKTRLHGLGLDNRGEIDVTFQKKSGEYLVDFSGADFDGNEARNKIKVEVKLHVTGGVIKKETYLMVYPNQEKLMGVLNTIRRALEIYYVQNGSYPASRGLDVLVPDYLAEIPNDPYTTERNKTTHKEEEIDYYYDHTGNTITLASHSHRDWSISWTY